MPSYDRALHALPLMADSWARIGHVVACRILQGCGGSTRSFSMTGDLESPA
jgi:hypothetical protein